MDKATRKYYWYLILACFFVYLSTICIKMVYSSEIVAIIEKFGETKARVGLGLTAYYVTYSSTQLILAPFVKKINMGKFMVVTILISAVLYGLIPFTTRLYHIWIIQAINGILHSSVWGGCMYFLGKYLPPDLNGLACSIMSMGFIGGTIVSYIVAPFFMQNGIWQYAFLLFAVIMFVAVITFIFVERRVESVLEHNNPISNKVEAPADTLPQEKDALIHKVYITLGITTVVSFAIHIAYYTISSWFPLYLNEIFEMPTTYSVPVTIVLYACSFGFTNLGFMLCEKGKKKFSNVVMAFSVIAVVLAVVQQSTFRVNLLLAIALPTLIVALARSIGSLLASYLPLKIKNYVNSATTAMLINAAASMGAAIGPTLSGSIIDNFGWSSYFVLMLGIYAVSLLAVLFATRYFKMLKI